VTLTFVRAKFLVPDSIFLFCFLIFSSASRATIRYELSLDHPERHLFHVTMTIPDVRGEVIVQMAAWNALYQIRDFSSHVQQVEAMERGQTNLAG
jgi:Peptidase M61 N-terminal domain